MSTGPSTRDYRRLLGAAVAIALVLRLVFALVYWVDKPLTVDQVEYLLLAGSIAEGRGIDYGTEERRLMRSPGYPIFLAAVRVALPGVTGVKIAQSLVGALTILLIAAMARRLGGDRTALAAAAIAAVYPPLVFQPAYILSETLYAGLGLSAALLLWRALDQPNQESWQRLVAGGVVAGIATLTRTEFLFFLVCFGVLVLARRRIRPVVIVAAATLVTIAPWPMYNVLVHDRIIFMSSRGGPNLWMGNNPLALGDGDVGSNPPMSREYDRISNAHLELSAEELERVFYDLALQFIGEEPGRWIGLEFRKAFYLLVPVGPSYASRSGLYRVAQASSWLLLLVLAGIGRRGLRRSAGDLEILGSLVGSVVLTALIFFPLARYRIPIVDPVLIVAAAGLAAQRLHTPARLESGRA